MSIRKAFISGVNGFVGKHLSSRLLTQGASICGVDVQENSVTPGIEYIRADINDNSEMIRIFKEAQPTEIYHLAAVTTLQNFRMVPFNSFQTNIMGSVSLMEAMRQVCPAAVMLIVGSSKEYLENQPAESVSELYPVCPSSFYGVSKYVVEIIGGYYVRSHNLDIRFTRSFNHTGPGQSVNFVCSDWASQIARIELKISPAQITVGNLNNSVDFLDGRDIARAYCSIVEKGRKGEAYNVCSGKGTSLKYILEYLLAKTSKKVEVCFRQEKSSAQDKKTDTIGDNSKIKRDTGWSQAILIEKTLDDIYEWWINELKVKSD